MARSQDEAAALAEEEMAQPAADSGVAGNLTPAATECPVNSHNEWDPLEEIIVGRLEGATIPSHHISVTFNVPRALARLHALVGGFRYPRILTTAAERELDAFIHILEAEGVTVRRPDVVDLALPYRTPDWRSRGFAVTCPRDGVLVIGDQIIETPMAWRSRYFETFAYRSLFKEYFAKGARWVAAPKPQLLDALYDEAFTLPRNGEPIRYVINELEPVFDAADFVRCGRDLFVTKSNVTNDAGITWLARHLGDGYRIHRVQSRCRQPMHIDSSFMPLAPGKVLVNPEYIDVSRLPSVLRSWDVLVAPDPDPAGKGSWRSSVSMCSDWISMNVLMLDEKRVVVEKSQISMIRKLADWGFEPIPCAFLNFAPFGGAFHCATLDVRRRGTLQSYF
jgi:glycine amidinotransferase